MTNRLKGAFRAVALAAICCAASAAAPILPPGDSLAIQLNPAGGRASGSPNGYTGWGFMVVWTSTVDHWIQFTGSTLGSVAPGGNESNPVLHQEPLIDFIGAQGGPHSALFALSPSTGLWMQPFDYVSSRGVGAFHIAADPIAEGAEDHGQITLFFDLYDGPPLPGSENRIDSLSYYGPDTHFSIIVTPEPRTFGLWLAAVGAGIAWRRHLAVRGRG